MNKMTIRFVLGLAALAAFVALPVYAQGHGHGGTASSHASSSGSNHGNSANSGHNSSGANTPSDRLADNTKLASKLASLLPAGTNLQNALQGFKNLGQFVAAVHVAHNLGIPFDQLKAKMMGPPKESLGKAIQQLKPAANAKAETKKANDEAKQDMNDSDKSS
jgi:hypothetical protein